MASFSDIPLEIIYQVIDALQDDLPALKACSQTCRVLLPLCRKYIFQTVRLIPRSGPSSAQIRSPPRLITLFGRLLNRNPGIADYVQNLVYTTESLDLQGDNYLEVLRTLERFPRVQLFHFHSANAEWNAYELLSLGLANIIQSSSLKCLELSNIRSLPMSIFIPCINLTYLSLSFIGDGGTTQSREQLHFSRESVAQLQSLKFRRSAEYMKTLVTAKCSDNLPVLDFSGLRSLEVIAYGDSDLVSAYAVISITDKLETFICTAVDLENGFTGLSTTMNVSSFSTLRILHFVFDIYDDTRDPLRGLCEEFGAFPATNVVEEITLGVTTDVHFGCKTGDEWGRLDTVLADGFPMLRRVSLSIDIWTYSPLDGSGIILQNKLNMLPKQQFPWLSGNAMVTFQFSTLMREA
ncbi:hypothetical protein CPB84DRAFT_1717056 [Gymnopilus junonius]|uniref:F-box domain-containing protein n=1 Tax=Gymnopilus junonius TaxID=109634 RepID=A0A9P5N703_GYMJU|nr:hypothetical protein CPB84DRAFT_1717056 [Gymnopilus junonius]